MTNKNRELLDKISIYFAERVYDDGNISKCFIYNLYGYDDGNIAKCFIYNLYGHTCSILSLENVDYGGGLTKYLVYAKDDKNFKYNQLSMSMIEINKLNLDLNKKLHDCSIIFNKNIKIGDVIEYILVKERKKKLVKIGGIKND